MMSAKRTASFVTLLAATVGIAVSGAYAQEKFPSKTIEVVTHAGVGGGTDITARMMMVQAPGVFKTELAVVNKVGGSGSAALAYADSRPKDGYTIMLITQTHLLTLLQNKAGKLTVGDIVGLARATDDPQILMVGKNSPYKTGKDFIEAAKSKSMKYGTTQIGSVDHIAVTSFGRAAGTQAPTVVPFRGGGDVVINLVGGNIDAALLNYAEAESQIKTGDVRALIVFAADKMESLPNTPTGVELGMKDAVYSTVRGFAMLKGAPEDRVKILEEGLVKAMNGQFFQNYLKTTGQSPKSVVGHKEWQAQIDEFAKTGKEALVALGIAK